MIIKRGNNSTEIKQYKASPDFLLNKFDFFRMEINGATYALCVIVVLLLITLLPHDLSWLAALAIVSQLSVPPPERI